MPGPLLTNASVPLTPFWMTPENVPLSPVFPTVRVSLFWSAETMPLPLSAPMVKFRPLLMLLAQPVPSLPVSSQAPLSVRSALANWLVVPESRPIPPPLTTRAPENEPVAARKLTPLAEGGVAVVTPVVLNDR